ncbi:MAG: ArsR family transcriptional regulator [Candidatus Glassbacteria bacterium RIFCSPLOWO2_12_FULL_58_11]|uniref:ArsR family transcriptional regulator n=2 Tax=Candidatus Glassiibacteriota TaxID=1817805 RepID=A0A1F5YPZ5_9BACT|nr:MAG: ArsR family transcriptional regulator [Candidatus Glassbacteria bacterium GWA2_58_10]OGG02057.1 MAG: ArsR family transcriptional regulator [Candidatus Glassbacteria bacterium RIFCSPLOWO2_12_FULL_58_11]
MKSPNRNFKDSIYEQFSRIGKAVSSPKRLELLDLICQSAKTVEALARETGLSVANASQHLQVLRTARLVEANKEGLFVHYRLADQAVCDFFRVMRELAESRLAEVEMITRRFLAGREGMEPVDRKKLIERVRDGSVVVLDVRPFEEFREGHIPGAISVQLRDLEQRLSELPRDQEIVAYCRGPYCVLSIQAVEMLRSRGFNAVRLEEGVQDWRFLGLPVAIGEKSGLRQEEI